VAEYCGEVISLATLEGRMATIYAVEQNYYFLSYAPGYVIDGGTKGAQARFINHSCEPNCHIEKW
jgi:SET domain-containing protein